MYNWTGEVVPYGFSLIGDGIMAMAADASKSSLHSIGDYQLLEKVAEGGMGTIYKGQHRQTGQIVAIKVVPANMLSNTVLLQRFEKEFKTASRLEHPNIVRALEYGATGSQPFLVMEFVHGESLGQRLERDGKMSEEDAIRIITLTAQALQHAHKMGLVHRDVKPDNIMVTPDGQVKLADLGLVKEMESDINLTRTGRGLGTPHFMAPEQFRNAKNADVRCDVYSLGATLYNMVTGKLPFDSMGPLDAWMKKVRNELTPARKLVPHLSERTDWAIRRAMSPTPEDRPKSCEEFVEDLTGKRTPPPMPTPADWSLGDDLWYLVYKDEAGEAHTVKGSTIGIRRSLKEGLLGDASNVRASKSKTGEFVPLSGFPEFRDLVPARPPGRGSAVREMGPSKKSSDPGSSNRVKNAESGTAPEAAVAADDTPVELQNTGMPHIQLEPAGSRTMELVKIGLWAIVLALATAALTFIIFGTQ